MESILLSNRTAKVSPTGNLLGGKESDQLRETALNCITKKLSSLIIDLSNVPYINSSGIGALVSIHTTYKRHQGRVVLCGINDKLHSIFAITNLAMVFEIYGTIDDALRELEEPSPL